MDESGGANWESSYRPSASLTGYSFAPPLVSLLFDPGGLQGTASVFAWQQNLIAGFDSSALTELFFAVNLVGQSGTGLFSLDPASGQLVLTVTPGVSGYLSAYSIAGINANYMATVSLLNYAFQTDPISHLLTANGIPPIRFRIAAARHRRRPVVFFVPALFLGFCPVPGYWDVRQFTGGRTHLDTSGILTELNAPEPGTIGLWLHCWGFFLLTMGQLGKFKGGR